MLITVPYDSKKNRQGYARWSHERPGYTEKAMQERKKDLTIVKSVVAEKVFELNYRMAKKSKVISGLTFYPLYVFALLSDFLTNPGTMIDKTEGQTPQPE